MNNSRNNPRLDQRIREMENTVSEIMIALTQLKSKVLILETEILKLKYK